MSERKKQNEEPEKADQENGKPMNDAAEIKERVGAGLKTMYLNVLEEPLPDDMMALLDQLDDDDGSNGSGSDA